MVASTMVTKSMTRGEAASLAQHTSEVSTMVDRECTTHQFSACITHRQSINYGQPRVSYALHSLYLLARSTLLLHSLHIQLRPTSMLCRFASSTRTGYSGVSGGAGGINYGRTMYCGVSHLHRRGINYGRSSPAHQTPTSFSTFPSS